jgi:hypothetical protein
VEIRVELFAFGGELLDTMPLECRQHRAFGHLDALDQRRETGIAGSPRLGRNCVERAAEIVGYRQHVASEVGDRVGTRVMHVARSAPTQIFHFGSHAQRAILQLFVFLHQAHDDLVVAFGAGRFGRDFRRRLFGLVHRRLFGRAFFFRMVAHRRFPSFGLKVAPDIEV